MTRVLWLCGPSGVGKSSVGFELFQQLGRDGGPVAFVDLDQLRLCHLGSGDEPDDHWIREHNLGAVYRGFVAAGARCVVVSGLVDDAARVRRQAELLPGAALTVCRLRADAGELRRRFTGRGSYLHLMEDSVRTAARLDRSAFADLVVDTAGLSVAEVALRVRAGWPLFEETACAPARSAEASRRTVGPVLLLCGPPAVGKSTVGFEVFTQAVGDGINAAYVDLEQISYCRPPPADDTDNHRLKAANLARMWEGFRAAGAECLVAGGNVTSLAHYTDAFASLTVCRLRASPGTLTDRVLLRGRGGGWSTYGDDLRGLPEVALRERAADAVRVAGALDRAGIGDVCVDTDGLDAAEIAARVRSRMGGWPRGGVQ